MVSRPQQPPTPFAPPSVPPAAREQAPTVPYAPSYAPDRRPRRRGAPTGIWLLAVLLAFFLGLTSGAIGAREYFGLGSGTPGTPSARATLPPSVNAAQSDVGKVAQAVLDSTVYIESYTGDSGGSGTGVIYNSTGTIVTNAHVINPTGETAEEISVVLPSGDRHEATVVGYTTEYDIAVLTIDAADLIALPLADSTTIAVGDDVVAVGAPLGLTGTVTTGIISATNRPVRSGETDQTSFINAVQTDAAINPGNSGGPLVNMAGQMIGLNSAIAQAVGAGQQATGSIGLGFAIPSSQVKHTADEILDKGYATYPVMGIVVDMADRRPGARILSEGDDEGVSAGGPADRAGLRAGDRIVSIDDTRFTSVTEFIVYLRARVPGETVHVVADRDGKTIEADVTLEEHRAD